MSETLYRKYRPSTFADVTDQEHIKRTLQNQLAQNTVAHAYLFTGPRGVGKTTVARLLAKAVNCENLKEGEPCNSCSACLSIIEGRTMDVFEIDAASHTGVENVRENIIDAVRFAPAQLKRKVYIIDEVHMLSTSAFNALLKTLEEPPAHALFILATTELHKVPETIISRCQRFDFHRLPTAAMVERLKMIAKEEKRKVDDDVLEAIAKRADGCLRDAESLFGQVLALGDGKKISMEEASLILPLTSSKSVKAYIDALLARDAKTAMATVDEAAQQGVRFSALEDEILEALREVLMTQPEATSIIEKLLVYRKQYANDRFPQLPLELLAVDFCQQGVVVDIPKRVAPTASAPLPVAAKPAEPPVAPSAPKPTASVSPAPAPQVAAPNLAADVTGPVSITFDDIRRKWTDCVTIIKDRSGTLPVILQDTELLSLEGNVLMLGTKVSFLADQLNQQRNRNMLIEVMRQVFQQPLSVSASCLAGAQDGLVADLLGEFGGSIVT